MSVNAASLCGLRYHAFCAVHIVHTRQRLRALFEAPTESFSGAKPKPSVPTKLEGVPHVNVA